MGNAEGGGDLAELPAGLTMLPAALALVDASDVLLPLKTVGNLLVFLPFTVTSF